MSAILWRSMKRLPTSMLRRDDVGDSTVCCLTWPRRHSECNLNAGFPKLRLLWNSIRPLRHIVVILERWRCFDRYLACAGIPNNICPTTEVTFQWALWDPAIWWHHLSLITVVWLSKSRQNCCVCKTSFSIYHVFYQPNQCVGIPILDHAILGPRNLDMFNGGCVGILIGSCST